MRKIKITALVLAVLMVMAAFAGCASKSAVEDLDERVTALEGKIDANQKANEEQIDKLAALIEDLAKSQSAIKESVESNKNDQAASNQEIKDSIAANQAAQNAADKALQDAIAANQAAQNAADKALQETLNQLLDKLNQLEKEQDDQAAADKADKEAAAELQTYKATAAAKIATLQASYLANKIDYSDADYVKITEILATANIAVEQAADKAAVDAAMAKLDTDLAAYTTVNQGLYNIYLELKGNIVPGAETKAKVEAAQAALTAAQKHYSCDGDPEFEHKDQICECYKLRQFATGGYLADGKTPKTIDLINAISVICTTFTSSVDTYNTTLVIVEPDGTKTTYATLAYVEARAKTLIAEIDYAVKKLDILLKNTDVIIALGEEYKAWLEFANLLSTENAAFVTNSEALLEHVAKAENLLAAWKAFGEELNFDAEKDMPTSIFADYTKLTDDDLGTTLYSNYEKVYTKIDAVLATWQAEYGLTNEQVADIVAANYTVKNQYDATYYTHVGFNYADYTADRTACKLQYDKYVEFSNEIAPRIVSLSNSFVSFNNNDHIKAFRQIAEDIRDWAVVGTDKNGNPNAWVTANNFNAMVVDIKLVESYTHGFNAGASNPANVDFLALYSFGRGIYDAEGVIDAFFMNTYVSAMVIADELNDRVDAAGKTADVFALITISGDYNVNTDGAGVRTFWAMHKEEVKAQANTAMANWFTTPVTVAPGVTVPVYKTPAEIEAASLAFNVASFQRSSNDFELASILFDYAAYTTKLTAIENKIKQLDPIADNILKAISGLDDTAATVNLDAHEAKLNAAYLEQYLPNWELKDEVVAWAAARASKDLVKKETTVAFDHDNNPATPDETIEHPVTVYTLDTLLETDQIEILHAGWAEVQDLRKQADVLIAAYKTIADMNTVAPITIKSIIDDTRWFEFSYAAKASKGIYYVNATAAKELFTVALYEDEVSEKEALANTLFATELAANALDYFDMIETVSEYYATFKADNADKTAKDVEAAKKKFNFAAYELMAKKSLVLEAVKAGIEDCKTSDATANQNMDAFYNTVFEYISAAEEMKAVENYLAGATGIDAKWEEYTADDIVVDATTYAGVALTIAYTIGD